MQQGSTLACPYDAKKLLHGFSRTATSHVPTSPAHLACSHRTPFVLLLLGRMHMRGRAHRRHVQLLLTHPSLAALHTQLLCALALVYSAPPARRLLPLQLLQLLLGQPHVRCGRQRSRPGERGQRRPRRRRHGLVAAPPSNGRVRARKRRIPTR